MNINANMKSVHSITGIPGSKKKRLPKNSGVFLLVSDSHTLGFPNPERLRRSEVCRMDIYHIVAAPFWQQEGGVYVSSILISFLISVIAGIVSYYICKWLDRNK